MPRIFHAAILGACVANVTSVPVAVPVPVEVCATSTMATVRAEARKQTGVDPTILTGDDAEVFIAAFNKSPPLSTVVADEIVLVAAGPGTAFIMMGLRGCLVQTARSLWYYISQWRGGKIPGIDS